MKHLVVIAEKEELSLVKKLGYEHYPVLITGVGALNVIEALKDIPRDTVLINIGYAGSKDLEPGRFYAVDSTSLYHPKVNLYMVLGIFHFQGKKTQRMMIMSICQRNVIQVLILSWTQIRKIVSLIWNWHISRHLVLIM